MALSAQCLRSTLQATSSFEKFVNLEDVKFQPNSTICLTGPSACGKSSLVYELLKFREQLFNNHPLKILYCYNIYQPLYDTMQDTLSPFSLHYGLPTIEKLKSFCDSSHNIVIIDDLSHLLVQNPEMEIMFTQLCHHMNISVIFVLHNLYQQGKCARTFALNTKYMILFKSPRGMSQIKILGGQTFPQKSQYLMESYKDATSKFYGYLLIDFSPNLDDSLRLRSDILPSDTLKVYIPSDCEL